MAYDNDHPLLANRVRYFLITAFFIVFTVAFVVFFLVNVRIKTVTYERLFYSELAKVEKAAKVWSSLLPPRAP